VQAFAELATAYAYLDDWGARGLCAALPQLSESLTAWRSFIVDLLDQPEFAEMPRKFPAQGHIFLVPYLMLRTRGFRSDYYEASLGRLETLGYLILPEAVPYRDLDR